MNFDLEIKLPRKHADDWSGRTDKDVRIVSVSERKIVFDLTWDSLADLISDAKYYSEEMGPENTDDIDYRPAARTCYNALAKQFVWDVRGSFIIENVRQR